MADLSPTTVSLTITGGIPTETKDKLLMAARAAAAMLEEIALRRPHWIGGVPTELDLIATRKAVARRLNTTPEAVIAAFETAIALLPLED